jgi:hypothetical protein
MTGHNEGGLIRPASRCLDATLYSVVKPELGRVGEGVRLRAQRESRLAGTSTRQRRAARHASRGRALGGAGPNCPARSASLMSRNCALCFSKPSRMLCANVAGGLIASAQQCRPSEAGGVSKCVALMRSMSTAVTGTPLRGPTRTDFPLARAEESPWRTLQTFRHSPRTRTSGEVV